MTRARISRIFDLMFLSFQIVFSLFIADLYSKKVFGNVKELVDEFANGVDMLK